MELKKQKINKCRVCNSKKIEKNIFKKKFYISNFDLDFEISYAICIDCQFIYQYDYVGDKFLNYYYSKSPMLRNPEETEYDYASIKRQLEYVKRNIDLKEIKSTLEIGAHTGHFLKRLSQVCKSEIYYDELSTEAKKILKSNKNFKEFKKNKKVDLIVLRHVLEHINNLDSFLKYIDNSLSENGSIFIEIPDWSILDNSTDPFLFEHLSQFNETCLINFFEKNNFKCHALERSINKDDPSTPNRVMRLIFKRSYIPKKGEKSFINYFKNYYDKKHISGQLKMNKIYSQLGNRRVGFFPASNLSFSAVLETETQKINLLGYFDSDKKKIGKNYLGYKVFSPTKLKKINPDVIFIFSEAYEPEIRNLIKKHGINPEIFSYSKIYGT